MSDPTKQNTTQQVKVSRTELPAPDLSDPNRKIIQIQYQVGDLPPHFVYIPKKEWSKEAEAKAIKEDLNKHMTTSGEMISI